MHNYPLLELSGLEPSGLVQGGDHGHSRESCDDTSRVEYALCNTLFRFRSHDPVGLKWRIRVRTARSAHIEPKDPTPRHQTDEVPAVPNQLLCRRLAIRA
jgi:hypothetical protein